MKSVNNFKEQLNQAELKRLAEVYEESDISSNLDLFTDYNEEEALQTSPIRINCELYLKRN